MFFIIVVFIRYMVFTDSAEHDFHPPAIIILKY